MTLTSMRGAALDFKLHKVISDAVRQQTESGYPQAIILSGKKFERFETREKSKFDFESEQSRVRNVWIQQRQITWTFLPRLCRQTLFIFENLYTAR